MKKIFLFLLLFNFLFLISYDKCYKKIELIPIDTLSKDVIYNASYFDSTNYIEYLIKDVKNLHNDLDSLIFFDAKTEERKYGIKFQTSYPLVEYNLHTLDSIFAIVCYQNKLCQFSRQGELVNEWDIKLFDDSISYEAYFLKPLINDDVIYFEIGADLSVPAFYNTKHIGMIKLLDGKIRGYKKIINYPDFYRQDSSYLLLDVNKLIYNNKELLISYGLSHDLYLYKDDTNYRTINVKSRYLDTFRYEQTNYRDQQIEDGKYSDILYDKYRNLYYRVVRHNQNMYNPDGTVNDYWDCSWSIIFLNSDLSIIDEIFFPAKKYLACEVVITSEGILLRNRIIRSIFEKEEHQQILYKLKLD
ncbi:MAG: DUF4221 family protein [Candidatus Kapaibacterium sp.]|jgi:hypothetical protein